MKRQQTLVKKQMFNKYFLAGFIFLFSSELLATAESDYQRGLAAYKAGDNAAAVTYFKSARQQGMDSVSLIYNLASSYYKLGRYAQAKKYFRLVNLTNEMRDIARYHLGLIAVKEKKWGLVRLYFSAIVKSGKDKKLVKLSKKHLAAVTKKEDRSKSYLSFNLGYDDNISSVSGDSTLDKADTFYDLFASVDLLIAGKRKDGWVVDAYVFGIDYSDTDTSDENKYALGLKRAMKLADWDTSVHLSLAKSTYGGDDFQSVGKLDVKARKPLSKREKIDLSYRYEDIASENSLYDYLEGWRQRTRIEYRQNTRNSIKKVYYELELNNRGELITLSDAYDYSPTRHTVRGRYTYIINTQWWLNGDLSYRMSEYPASSTIDREDNQWKLALSAEYRFDRTLKLTSKLQHTDNASSVDRYVYDKSVIKLGLSKLF